MQFYLLRLMRDAASVQAPGSRKQVDRQPVPPYTREFPN